MGIVVDMLLFLLQGDECCDVCSGGCECAPKLRMSVKRFVLVINPLRVLCLAFPDKPWLEITCNSTFK